jgi:hypothetical protein
MPSMASAWMHHDSGGYRPYRSPLDSRSVLAEGIDETKEALHLPLALVGELARRPHPGQQAADPAQQQQALDATTEIPGPSFEDLVDLRKAGRRPDAATSPARPSSTGAAE